MPETPGTDATTHTPHWARIAAVLRDGITTGHYPPGSLLPSYPQLSATYGVSTTTARRALAQITGEGLAEAVRGRGTIVTRARPRRHVPARRYRPADGPAPQAEETVIDTGTAPLPADIAHLLNLAPDAQVPHHHNLITSHGATVELRSHYGDSPQTPSARYASEHITARPSTPEETSLLGCAVVLCADTTLYDQDRAPLAVTRSIWPADRTRLTDYYAMP